MIFSDVYINILHNNVHLQIRMMLYYYYYYYYYYFLKQKRVASFHISPLSLCFWYSLEMIEINVELQIRGVIIQIIFFLFLFTKTYVVDTH